MAMESWDYYKVLYIILFSQYTTKYFCYYLSNGGPNLFKMAENDE